MAITLGCADDAINAGKLITGGWLLSKSLKDVGMKILQRDKLICQECGFRGRFSQQYPHGWMVPVDRTAPSLIAQSPNKGQCLCPMCASCLAINWSVVPQGVPGRELPAPGILVLYPHMTQAELNRLALHTVSIVGSPSFAETPLLDMARNVDCSITALNSELTSYLSFFRHECDAEFAQALNLLPANLYDERAAVISPLRWWPTMAFWQEAGMYWMEATYRKEQIAVDL